MDIGIYFKGYKNFSEDVYVGFDHLKKFNVIIGKNNIGKSKFLDLIDILPNNDRAKEYKSLKLSFTPDAETIKKFFPAAPDVGDSQGEVQKFGLQYEGKTIEIELSGGQYSTISLSNNNEAIIKEKDKFREMALTLLSEEFNSKKVIRMDADRNIVPERTDNKICGVNSDGNGATNLLRRYINNNTLDEKMVENKMLKYLNEIMEPDFNFTSIMCQEIENTDKSNWEIYLEEKNKRRIALSDSGSGLRTILLLLINLILVPDIKGYEQKQIIYIFEELENNLHPSIQRNLFRFLKRWVSDNDNICYLTTHSSIPLNLFVKEKEAQVLHIYKESDNTTYVKTVFDDIDNNSVMDDIGIQASDIMQSNCVIWVEGPSDRIYINKWIELATKGELVESIDYQILFYGGRLLSHLSATEGNEFINLLKANRHSIIIMDSDKKHRQTSINDTKKRIIEEFEKGQSIAWITKGREIENYLSEKLLKQYFSLSDLKFGQYDKIEEKLNEADIKSKCGEGYKRNKVGYAKLLTKEMNKDALSMYDLNDKIGEIVNKIEKWN